MTYFLSDLEWTSSRLFTGLSYGEMIRIINSCGDLITQTKRHALNKITDRKSFSLDGFVTLYNEMQKGDSISVGQEVVYYIILVFKLFLLHQNLSPF
jgi:hypothetical protein